VKAKQRTIQKMDELGKQLTREHDRTRKKGGMSESKKEQMIEAYREKERLKGELKKAQQDETGRKNPVLERR